LAIALSRLEEIYEFRSRQ